MWQRPECHTGFMIILHQTGFCPANIQTDGNRTQGTFRGQGADPAALRKVRAFAPGPPGIPPSLTGDTMKISERFKKNKQSGYLVVIGVLSSIIVCQGYFLLKARHHEAEGVESFFSRRNRNKAPFDLLDKLKEKLNKDNSSTRDVFEKFFDDNFFARSNDPFKEIEEWRKKLHKNFGQDNWAFFDQSWGNWYNDKFDASDIHISTEEKADKIVMRFKISGLENNTLNIDIDNKRIRLECDIKEEREEKDADGSVLYRSSSRRHISKVLPVPGDADSEGATIENRGDEIILTFPKT